MQPAHRTTVSETRNSDASSHPERSGGGRDEAELWRDLRECALLLLAFHAGNVVAPIVGAFSRPGSPHP